MLLPWCMHQASINHAAQCQTTAQLANLVKVCPYASQNHQLAPSTHCLPNKGNQHTCTRVLMASCVSFRPCCSRPCSSSLSAPAGAAATPADVPLPVVVVVVVVVLVVVVMSDAHLTAGRACVLAVSSPDTCSAPTGSSWRGGPAGGLQERGRCKHADSKWVGICATHANHQNNHPYLRPCPP